MWVKKCIEIRKILFKNLKLLFGNTHQTHPNIPLKKNIPFKKVNIYNKGILKKKKKLKRKHLKNTIKSNLIIINFVKYFEKLK